MAEPPELTVTPALVTVTAEPDVRASVVSVISDVSSLHESEAELLSEVEEISEVASSIQSAQSDSASGGEKEAALEDDSSTKPALEVLNKVESEVKQEPSGPPSEKDQDPLPQQSLERMKDTGAPEEPATGVTAEAVSNTSSPEKLREVIQQSPNLLKLKQRRQQQHQNRPSTAGGHTNTSSAHEVSLTDRYYPHRALSLVPVLALCRKLVGPHCSSSHILSNRKTISKERSSRSQCESNFASYSPPLSCFVSSLLLAADRRQHHHNH